jgi:DNA-binding response OmpR family regulator
MAFYFDRMSVLIVEDEEPMKKLMCSMMETLGVRVILRADNGAQGFALFQEETPDIVLTDWHMSPVSGIDLVHEIRRNPLSRNRLAPIILISGYNARQRIADARDCGATEYLVKPFTADDLAKRIAYVVNRPRDFIDNMPDFFGPDRRRTRSSAEDAPRRRQTDIGRSSAL